MAQADSLHIEDDDVAVAEAVLGQSDVVEEEERLERVVELQFARVVIYQPVHQNSVAFGRRFLHRHQLPASTRIRQPACNRRSVRPMVRRPTHATSRTAFTPFPKGDLLANSSGDVVLIAKYASIVSLVFSKS